MGKQKNYCNGKGKADRYENGISNGNTADNFNNDNYGTCDFNNVRRRIMFRILKNKSGMEMVQVAILVAIAVALGIIFKSQITSFVNDVFSKLDSGNF